ncbi:flagellar assembly peptidoglycan hydrolase FlgJ [Halomonas nitroreducens]|uniref:Peptidoglycan hydrolase FlgJ n=1 Tax=Halomonas nitroreducens TaxID=447425 RepID=A0A3S0KR84_9GAMM|nr:flagellar assembly peptidoglycan hydrolase FlgJ [Halomonas nitroreducens]RTR04390.1 flagellar assembly peptidoglycan hydrolase FlgJ [Halomonas nitroreducens]
MSLDTPDPMSAQFALDVQGLERLKHSTRPGEGLDAAAKQFEALFVQMMMKSMRDAVPSSGLLDSRQTEFYQELLDKQWSQGIAERGMGLAERLVAQLDGRGGHAREARAREIEALIAGIPRGTPRPLENALRPADAPGIGEVPMPASFLDELQATAGAVPTAEAVPRASAPPREAPAHVRDFLDRLAGPARAASRASGVPAELILAQAALETGWGRHEIATADGGNSHNLFGIKAGSAWQGETTEILTHEVVDGRRQAVRDRFRVYGSFEEAFTDYARLIGGNPRYAGVVAADSADQAARALQQGGYATDPAYADKLIAVMDTLGPLPDGSLLADARPR